MRGVNQQELQSILQFMYLGEVNIKQNTIEKFLEIAEDFQIEGFMQNFRNDQLSATDLVESVDFEKLTEDKLTSVMYTIDETYGLDTTDFGQNGNQLKKSTDQLHKCGTCEIVFKLKISLIEHQKSAHSGNVLFCYQCDYQTTQMRLLKVHQKSTHEGLHYVCNQCAYQATEKDDLKEHQQP